MIVVSDGVGRQLTEAEWLEFLAERGEDEAASVEYHGFEVGEVHNLPSYVSLANLEVDPFASLLVIDADRLFEIRHDAWLDMVADQCRGPVRVADYGEDCGPWIKLSSEIENDDLAEAA